MFDTCFSSPLQQKLAASVYESARFTAGRMVKERKLRIADLDDYASELAFRLLIKLRAWDQDRLPLDIYLSYCTRNVSRKLLRCHRYNLKAQGRFTSLDGIEGEMDEVIANKFCPSWKEQAMPDTEISDFIQDLADFEVSLSETEKRFLSLLQDHSVYKAATLSSLGRKRADQLLCELRERLSEEF